MKKCIKCNEEKPLTEFHIRDTSEDGYDRACIVCVTKMREDWQQRHMHGDNAATSNQHEDCEVKKCTGCNRKKPLSQFYKDAKSSDGHSRLCKICRDIQKKQWRAKQRRSVL